MNNGLSRFTFYLQQIKELLIKSRNQKNPALWLFVNNARTPFFMLEGLAKLYTGILNPKKFGKQDEHFKLIEDGLGQIDYYNWLLEAIKTNQQIPVECTNYIKKQLDLNLSKLNEELIQEDWLSADNKRIIKITDKLNTVDWLNPAEEVKAISNFYKESISIITAFATKSDFHFHNVEKEVHELRRKLRWLSIYPQALQGIIQYESDTKTPEHLKKYLTKEIINSPYTILPAAGQNDAFIMFDKNYFFALSWIIAELGKLKDEGLLLIGLSEALKQSLACNEVEALAKAYTLLGKKQRKLEIILDNADAITKTFFKEKNLEHLIVRR